MGLIQNGYSFMSAGVQFVGLTVSNGAIPATHHYNFHQTGRNRNLTAGEGIANDKISVPVGSRPPECWIMAQKTGGLASTGSRVAGSGSTGTVNLAGGLNAVSTMEGSGSIDSAAMGLVMSAVASIAGTGGLTASMVGSIAAAADIAGLGGLSAALGAIAGGLATLAGIGGVCCSDLRADGYMSADIAPATTVAADVIGRAVLDAVIENGLSLADVQKLLLAVAAGNATGLDSNPVFKSQDGTIDRITGTLSAGNRTVDTIDVT